MIRSIDKRVESIKNNNKEIDIFIEEYKPFIVSSASKFLNNYIDYNNDEEYSIALLAFNEAINTYKFEKGGFLSFAQNIIKYRLIDYLRKESKQKNILTEGSFENEESESFNILDKNAMEVYQSEGVSYLRKLEIEQLSIDLIQYGITFEDLIKASPKWGTTKKIYNQIINASLKSNEVMKNLIDKKTLNIKELEKLTSLPRKKIERSRRYIIAVLVVIIGDYQYLRDYINLEV